MKVKIEFEIHKKLDLEFGTIIQSINKIFKKFNIKWKYTVETTIDELIDA